VIIEVEGLPGDLEFVSAGHLCHMLELAGESRTAFFDLSRRRTAQVSIGQLPIWLAEHPSGCGCFEIVPKPTCAIATRTALFSQLAQAVRDSHLDHLLAMFVQLPAAKTAGATRDA
jgi:hypothetical protein